MAVLNGWHLFAQRQASRSLTQVGNPSARMHWAQLPPLWFNRNRVQPWVLGRMQSFRLGHHRAKLPIHPGRAKQESVDVFFL